MTEAQVGRVLPACLHQAISEVLPDRLEYYEEWLSPDGLRDGSIGLAPASRLGGPKPQTGAEPDTPALNGKMDFLREAHQAACRIFGTVLGPEANSAHKNHFHVDMADRKGFTICE